jgi:hypothetical protein
MNLGDPTLRISAELLDDLEGNRIANENRLRQLTRAETDSDGEERGFGLTDDHPVVARVTHLVEGLLELEKEAIANLQKIMRAHPLGPWVKRQPGIGEKQMARLLAAIGDPYIRPVQEKDGVVQQPRPRSVSELWAYSGMHVWDLPIEGAEGQRTDDAHGTIAPGHRTDDTQMPSAEGLPTIDAHDPHAPGQPSSDNHPPSAPGQTNVDTHTVTAGIAPFRQRGRRLNWSEDARKRVRLIADSCVKQPNGTVWRDIYTAGREKYANAVHKRPCKRCGPSGKPARIGSPLSEGHKDAGSEAGGEGNSEGAVARSWTASRAGHSGTGQKRSDTHPSGAGDPRTPDSHRSCVTGHRDLDTQRRYAGDPSPYNAHRLLVTGQSPTDTHRQLAGQKDDDTQRSLASHSPCDTQGRSAGQERTDTHRTRATCETPTE